MPRELRVVPPSPVEIYPVKLFHFPHRSLLYSPPGCRPFLDQSPAFGAEEKEKSAGPLSADSNFNILVPVDLSLLANLCTRYFSQPFILDECVPFFLPWQSIHVYYSSYVRLNLT